MKVREWTPDEGDALQGDVILFRIPDHVVINAEDEIAAHKGRLVLAEGEVTGHHHAIWLRGVTMFRDDGAGSGGVSEHDTAAMLATATKTAEGTAKLYRDDAAVRALIASGELEHGRLAIGILVVSDAPVIRHPGMRLLWGQLHHKDA